MRRLSSARHDKNMNLQNLYKSLILDHNKSPQNFGELKDATNKAEGFNPLCGDHYWVELNLDADTITDIKFHGQGCAISKASASLMTSAVKGQKKDFANAMIEQFIHLITGKSEQAPNQRLEAFKGVRDFPTRTKCASLAWHALESALKKNSNSVSTE